MSFCLFPFVPCFLLSTPPPPKHTHICFSVGAVLTSRILSLRETTLLFLARTWHPTRPTRPAWTRRTCKDAWALTNPIRIPSGTWGKVGTWDEQIYFLISQSAHTVQQMWLLCLRLQLGSNFCLQTKGLTAGWVTSNSSSHRSSRSRSHSHNLNLHLTGDHQGPWVQCQWGPDSSIPTDQAMTGGTTHWRVAGIFKVTDHFCCP